MSLALLSTAYASPCSIVGRVQAHILVGDIDSALSEVLDGGKQYPDERILKEWLIRTLAEKGEEKELMEAWHDYAQEFPGEEYDSPLLEAMAWGIIREGSRSFMPEVRLASMIGAASTGDARALPILIHNMRSNNTFLRRAAVRIASQFGDNSLQDEVVRLFYSEQDWLVRLEIIKALGVLKIKSLHNELKDIVAKDTIDAETKATAVAALTNMMEKASVDDLSELVMSDRAGLRLVACNIVLSTGEANEVIEKLIGDSNSDVRMAALQAVKMPFSRERVERRLSDTDLRVVIAAAWALTINNTDDTDNAESLFNPLLNNNNKEISRLASAVLAATGKYGTKFAAGVLDTIDDQYVKANIAIGLIGQRVEVGKAYDAINMLLSNEHNNLMWKDYGIFRVLMPSVVEYDDHIQNYPLIVDRMTRLELLNILAIIDPQKTQSNIRMFLKERSWGVTGVAALTLMTEGNNAALDIVRDLLHDDDTNVRIQAALVMALWGREGSALTVLYEAYHDADTDVKYAILEALGTLGNPDSLSFIVPIMGSTFQIERISAATSLLK